jgi:hypothetical protein
MSLDSMGSGESWEELHDQAVKGTGLTPERIAEVTEKFEGPSLESAQEAFASLEAKYDSEIEEARKGSHLYDAVNHAKVKLGNEYVLFDFDGRPISKDKIYEVLDKIKTEKIQDGAQIQRLFDTICPSTASLLSLRNRVVQMADRSGGFTWGDLE